MKTSSSNKPIVPNQETIQQSIENETFRQIRGLSVSIQEGLVNVTGLSKSFYLKQLVTRAVQSAAPQARIANNVTVFVDSHSR